MRTLLSPLEHDHVDEWRATVNRTVRALVGADMVSFQLPNAAGEALYSDEVDKAQLRRYLPAATALDASRLVRTADLGVCTRQTLWGRELPDFYASAYYNEFVVPLRAFDMMCVSARLDGEEQPAILYLHHESRHGSRFGTRGVQILRMLQPAFEAGTRTWRRFHVGRANLFRMLDAMDEAVCLFDMDGVLLHRGGGYRRLTLGDKEDDALSTVAGEVARGLAALCSARRSRGLAGGLHATRDVWLATRRFRLEGSLLEGMANGSEPTLLVTIREDGPAAAPTVSEPVAMTRESVSPSAEPFDLTPRQAEVAALLARRLTNRELAERLGISVHTARHHTEHVLRKLGINSRRDVAAKLAEIDM